MSNLQKVHYANIHGHALLVGGHRVESGIAAVPEAGREHALCANYNRKTPDPVHCSDKLLPAVSKLFRCCHYSL